MVEAATTSGLAQGEQSLADGDWVAATEAFESALMIGADPSAFTAEALPSVSLAHYIRSCAYNETSREILAGASSEPADRVSKEQPVAATVTPFELFHEIADGTVSEILDVRNLDEFEVNRLEGSRPEPTRNVPVYRVMEEFEEQSALTRQGAVVICGKGNGSAMVAEEFEALGIESRSLEGGTDAWNRLLIALEITGLPGDVRVWQFQRPAKACLSYLELAASHKMTVTRVVDTHVHADHISGGLAMAAALGVEYHLPPEDVAGIASFPNRPLKDGDVLDLGSAVVRAMSMHLPGHTPGSIALLVSDTVLLVGPLDPHTIIAPAHWSASAEINAEGLVVTTLEHVFTATLLNDREIRGGDRRLLAIRARHLRHDPSGQRRPGRPSRR